MIRNELYKYKKKFDHFKLSLKKKLNLFDPFIIYPYRGYANNRQLRISGRVLEKEGILKDQKEPSHIGEKLLYMFRRFESDEIPFVEIEADFNGDIRQVKADEEGFFRLSMDMQQPLTDKGSHWMKVGFRMSENPYNAQQNVYAEGEVLFPGQNSRFVIVSDVDDTIIKSHATDTLLKMKTLLLNTAETRIPLEGVASFYRAMQQHREAFNPLFFVSGSTWNMYDLLESFCEIHDIPPAPFFLKELGLSPESWIKKETIAFKLEKLENLMAFYEELPFVLIGDSGQKDPEIYYRLAREHPGWIKAIYIRKIHDEALSTERQKNVEELKDMDIDMLYIENTKEAEVHAVKTGLIEG